MFKENKSSLRSADASSRKACSNLKKQQGSQQINIIVLDAYGVHAEL
jgi:hypothetical protein